MEYSTQAFNPETDDYYEEKVLPAKVDERKSDLAKHGWVYYRQANVVSPDEHNGKIALSFKRPKKMIHARS
jgi:hypothetical protein